MHGIERDVGVAVLEGDFDDDEVVDVVEILSNPLSGDVRVNIANDEVPGGPNTYLVCNMSGKDELPVIPSKFDLALLVSNLRRPSTASRPTLLPWM